MSSRKLSRSIAKYVRLNFPGLKAAEVVIRTDCGREIKMPIVRDRSGLVRKRKLSESHLVVLSHCPLPTEAPQEAKRIAKGAGYTYSGYFRQRLIDLVAAGKLEKIEGKYRRLP